MSKAEEQAINDIKSEIEDKNSKCFITKSFIKFRQFLNPIMDCLVEQQLDEQEKLKQQKYGRNQ